MTVEEAIRTIIQQNKKSLGLITDAISEGDIKHDELEALVKNNKTEISKLKSSIEVFGLDNTSVAQNNDLATLRTILNSDSNYNSMNRIKESIIGLGDNYKSLYDLANTVKSFIESTDTADKTINTWKEIENFLNGITDDKDLLKIINDSISNNNKNYYTKEEIDATIEPFVDNGFTVLHFENGSNVNCQKLIDIWNSGQDNLTKVIGVFKYTDHRNNLTYYYTSNINYFKHTVCFYSNVFMHTVDDGYRVNRLFKFKINSNGCVYVQCYLENDNFAAHSITYNNLATDVVATSEQLQRILNTL